MTDAQLTAKLIKINSAILVQLRARRKPSIKLMAERNWVKFQLECYA